MNPDKTLYQLVAFYGYNAPHGAILCSRGEWMERDIDEVGAKSVDDLGIEDAAPADGLWVWEGAMRLITRDTCDGTDYDTVFSGSWRPLTSHELELLLTEGDAFEDRRDFMSLLADGHAKADEIDTWLDAYSEVLEEGVAVRSLLLKREYLGMTEQEFERWKADPSCLDRLAEERRSRKGDIPAYV